MAGVSLLVNVYRMNLAVLKDRSAVSMGGRFVGVLAKAHRLCW